MDRLPFNTEFPSSLERVDQEVLSLLQYLDGNIGDYNRFAVDLVLREVLNNAVIHGNQYDQTLKVRFSFSVNETCFQVEVGDEGPGFNWRPLLDIELNPEDERGRGFPILLNCHSCLRFASTLPSWIA